MQEMRASTSAIFCEARGEASSLRVWMAVNRFRVLMDDVFFLGCRGLCLYLDFDVL